MLKIENLSVKLDGKEILKDINIEVGNNEVHAIMGPNGSGKSTLSKIIAGADGYDVEGKALLNIYFKEHNLLELTPEERSLKGFFMSFQHPVEISGLSNFTFLRAIFNSHLKSKGASQMDPLDFKEHLQKYISELKINPTFLERSLNEGFSGGEKKRNEMLQLMLLEPKVAFLDEIDSGLDVDSLKIISNTINSLRDKSSFVLITHYNRILEHVTPDYVHILADGKIVKSGDASLAKKIEERGYNWI